MPLEKKISAICHKVYHAKHMFILANARKKAKKIEEQGFGDLPICMAKTQYSFSDDPKLLGAPQGFTVQVTDVKVCAGAGFVVAYAGDIMTMPGLPKSLLLRKSTSTKTASSAACSNQAISELIKSNNKNPP